MFKSEKIEVTKVKGSYRKVYSEIVINASRQEVWEVLTDFESYSNWSVHFKNLTGNFIDGGNVVAFFQINLKRKKLTKFNHILRLKKGIEFSWRSHIMLGMMDHHVFRIEQIDKVTSKFIQMDECKGGLTFLLGKIVVKKQYLMYQAFNRNLKIEVEKRNLIKRM